MVISIHALRGEGDGCPPGRSRSFRDFYPRPPWGGRPDAAGSNALVIQGFLSTPSVGRATMQCQKSLSRLSNFYPRPPWGGRLARRRKHKQLKTFLSTPSVGRATVNWAVVKNADVFLSTPSVGRATGSTPVSIRLTAYFYPRPPWGGRPSPTG